MPGRHAIRVLARIGQRHQRVSNTGFHLKRKCPLAANRLIESQSVLLHRFISSTNASKLTKNQIQEIQENRGFTQKATVTEFPDGKTCLIKWADGFQATFHAAWLRHNCHCPECRHENGQKLLDPASIPATVTIKSISIQDDEVKVCWTGEEEDHHGMLPLSFLREQNYSAESILARSRAVKCDKPADTIPTISYDEITSSEIGLMKWLLQINEAGLSIVTGVPIGDEMVQEVGELIGPVPKTIYDKIFTVESVDDPINVAYSDIKLDLHQDLVYFESPPGLQLLHCVKFDECVKGGESVFVDLFAVMEDFRATYPKLFNTLATVPATFQKVHYERADPVHIVNQKPHVKLNHLGEIIAVYWAPAFEGPLAVREEDVENYYRAYAMLAKAIKHSSYTLEHRLQPGELVIFNNLRMLHGRKQFWTYGGKRCFKGCYVNIDMFKSKTQVLSNLHGDGRLAKRVGNQCFF